MCIAIAKPENVVLARDLLENCFSNNDDGAGFAYTADGAIKIEKGFFKFEEFWAAWQPHQAKQAIIHFRIKTHGAVCMKNCHPWPITGHEQFSFAVIHNGVLSYASSFEKSDTGHFVDEVLNPLLVRDPWFLDTPTGVTLLERAIGSHNKMVLLRNDGKVYIINGSAGTVEHESWFSNTSYRTRWGNVGATTVGGYGMYGGDDDDYRPYSGHGVTGGHATGASKSGQQHQRYRDSRLPSIVGASSAQIAAHNRQYWARLQAEQKRERDEALTAIRPTTGTVSSGSPRLPSDPAPIPGSDGPAEGDAQAQVSAAAEEAVAANKQVLDDLMQELYESREHDAVETEMDFQAGRASMYERSYTTACANALNPSLNTERRTYAAEIALRNIDYRDVRKLVKLARNCALEDGYDLIGRTDFECIEYLRHWYRTSIFSGANAVLVPDTVIDKDLLALPWPLPKTGSTIV